MAKWQRKPAVFVSGGRRQSGYIVTKTGSGKAPAKRKKRGRRKQVWIGDREPAATEAGLPGIGHWEKI